MLQATNPPATLLWQEIEDELLAVTPILPTANHRVVDFTSKRVGNYQYTRNRASCSASSG